MAEPDDSEDFPETPLRRWDDQVNMGRRVPRLVNAVSTGQLLIAAAVALAATSMYIGRASWQSDANQKQLEHYHDEVAALTDTNKKQQDQGRSEVASQINNVKSDLLAKIAEIRADQAGQIAQLQLNTNKQFDSLAIVITNLPGMKERLEQLERRVDQGDSRFDAQSKRLESVQSQTIENTVNINNLAHVLSGSHR